MQKKISIVSIIGVLVAILGIVAPITWDYYKTKSEVELRVIEQSLIISKPKKLDGLVITYHDKPLEELSKTVFVVTNTGGTPILKKDVAIPISIKFPKDSNILDVKLEGMQPKDLGALLHYDQNSQSITLDFPLLNPGDRVDFSVLAGTHNIEFLPGGRIAGVQSLKIVKEALQEKVNKSPSWIVYTVAFFSILLIIISIEGFRAFFKEIKFKAKLKRGQFTLPDLKTRNECINWVNSYFSFTTKSERGSLIVLLRKLPDTDNFSTTHHEEILSAIKEMSDNAISNFIVLIIVLAIALLGILYVFGIII